MVTIHSPAQILGQGMAIQLLGAALQRERVTTAYCFAGPEGVGKGLTARWFTQALLCESGEQVPCQRCLNCRLVQQGNHPDHLWVEPTFLHQGKRITAREAKQQQIQRRGLPQIRLEQVQEIVTFAARTPLRSPRSVVVVEGAQTLAEAAANALLKTLEEPGPARVILISPSLSDLLPTLVSRCQTIPFRRLSAQDLAQILAAQDLQDLTEIPPVLLTLAQGSPGVALEAIEHWRQIPRELLEELYPWPRSLPQALALGRTIAKTLDVPEQIWLVSYLQHQIWASGGERSVAQIKTLDQIRRQLLSYVQPQLVWEVNLSNDLLNA